MADNQSSAELTEFLSKARTLHEEGKTLEALEHLEAGADRHNSPRVWALIAHFYYMNEQFETSAASAQRALELNPKNRLALQTMGEICMKSRNFPEAESWFKETIESGPRSAHPFLRLASVYLAQRQYSNAINVLYSGLEKFTGHVELLERLHYALMMDGRTREAADIRKTRIRAESSDTPDIRALLNRFEALERTRAVDQLKTLASMEHYRSEAALHDQLARYLIELERYSEAVPFLNTVLELQGRNDHARLNLALCLIKSDELQRAWTILDAMGRYRDDVPFLIVRIEALVAEGRLSEALGICMESLRSNPRDKRLRKWLQTLKRKGARPSQVTEDGTMTN